MNGLVPMYDESGQKVWMTPEAAVRASNEGSATPYNPAAIYSPEAAQQLAEFNAALQGEDVYTRRLQALAQQYGAQTAQYSAVSQNAYNMGQLLMNASINNPYQYAQEAFNTNGGAPGFARALQQDFSYGKESADPFDKSRLQGWDFGKTSAEQGAGSTSPANAAYGAQTAASSTPPASSSTAPAGGSGGLTIGGDASTNTPWQDRQAGVYPGSTTHGVRIGGDAYTTTPWQDRQPGVYPGAAVPSDAMAASGGYSDTSAAPATSNAADTTAIYGSNGKVDTGQYARASGLSGSGSSDIAWKNKSHDLIQQRGYGHGSDARNAAHAAAGMTGEEFDRIVKHGGDPFKKNQATGGIQVATHPQTVHVGEGGRDELLIALPLQRPGTAVPGFAAQLANDLHPQGHYAARGGASPPGLHFAAGGGAISGQARDDWNANPGYTPRESTDEVGNPITVIPTSDPAAGGYSGVAVARTPATATTTMGGVAREQAAAGGKAEYGPGYGADYYTVPGSTAPPVPERAVAPVNLPHAGGRPMAGGGYGGGAPSSVPTAAPAIDPALMGKAARWWAFQHGGSVAEAMPALLAPENADYLMSALGMAAAGEIDQILGPEQAAQPAANNGPYATTGLTRDPNWQRNYLAQQAGQGRGDYAGAVMGGVNGGLRLGGRVTDANTPVHLAEGGAVYGAGVNTLGIGKYTMSGGNPTPQGSVKVWGNRGSKQVTRPIREGITPAGMADPHALDTIASNKFLATQYDSLLKTMGYAGLDDYLARNQAARPQQRVAAGIGYRGY